MAVKEDPDSKKKDAYKDRTSSDKQPSPRRLFNLEALRGGVIRW